MDGKFNSIIRKGRKGVQLDMYHVIEDLQDEYCENLNASLTMSEDYNKVSDETLNDCLNVKRVLFAYCSMGYLYREEYEDMCEVADELRLNKLKELEGNNEASC